LNCIPRALDWGSKEELNDRDRPFVPSLIIVSPSVIVNWSIEIQNVEYFSVSVFQNKDHTIALERTRNGMDDVNCFVYRYSYKTAASRWWRIFAGSLFVNDEYHEYINGKLQLNEKIEELLKTSNNPLLRWIRIVMLVNLVQAGVLDFKKSFNTYISRSIMIARCVFQT